MKRMLLIPAIALVAGLFVASLAIGAEMGVGSASGESQEVMMGYKDLSQMQVQKMQKMLNEKGHMAGPEDGMMGPKTKKALKSFQTSQGLEATGMPDSKTLEALGVGSASGEMPGVGDKQ